MKLREMFSKNKSQRICRRVALVIVFHLVILLHLLDNGNCQLSWSPIQVDSESEYIDACKYCLGYRLRMFYFLVAKNSFVFLASIERVENYNFIFQYYCKGNNNSTIY